MSHSLLIFGASVRAAACSALTGGELPRCGDQFADRDLVERCRAAGGDARAVEEYPTGLVEIARDAGGAWMYTGALENHPRLAARLMEFGTLLGCGPHVLRRVRDPFQVAETLHAAGLAVPEVRRECTGLPRDGSWLKKSQRSSAGFGVEVLSAAPKIHGIATGHYFQQRIAGQSAAAIFLAAGGSAALLGATHQIFDAPRGSPGEFRYAGSVGPLELDAHRIDTLGRLGNVLAGEFELSGLFGVDYIDDGRQIFPVEVNPRYTASVEILERAEHFSAVQLHVAACRQGLLPVDNRWREAPSPAVSLDDAASVGAAACTVTASWHAKRILTAPCDVRIATAFSDEAMNANRALPAPQVADIPWPATLVPAGAPVMTIFAQGETQAAALASLERSALQWRDRLLAMVTPGS